jgi:hypothetical protein
MMARVFTLRFDPLLDAFDDGPMRDFLKDRELLSICDHYFEHDGRPYIAVTVTFRCDGAPAVKPVDVAPAERKNLWRELLETDDLPLFNSLREWRSTRAKADGVPPYVICTNRQLAMLVRARPQSVAKIGEVEGFGRNKLEKYGRELVAQLRSAPAAAEAKCPERKRLVQVAGENRSS